MLSKTAANTQLVFTQSIQQWVYLNNYSVENCFSSVIVLFLINIFCHRLIPLNGVVSTAHVSCVQRLFVSRLNCVIQRGAQ